MDQIGVEALHDHQLSMFESAARNASLISFDLFDTLLIRKVASPSDVFRVMALALEGIAPRTAALFMDSRIKAEKQARAAHEVEVSLAQIYAELGEHIAATMHDEKLSAQELMAREEELEYELAMPDLSVVGVFERLKILGIPIVIVTDMYLPLKAIERLIAKIGVAGHAGIHLSCLMGLSKADGSVWDAIRHRFGLVASDHVVHLGDHPDADGFIARAQGVDAYLLKPSAHRHVRSRLAVSDNWFIGACEAMLQQAIRRHDVNPNVDRYWLVLAYLVVLPVAVGMTRFIVDFAKRIGSENIFFLARDGLIFKKVFEALRPDDCSSAHYVWASRRCLNMAVIEKIDDDDLRFLMGSGRELLCPADYLRRINVDIEEPGVAKILQKCGLDPERVIKREDRSAIHDLLRASAPWILNRAATEREALLAHLDELGIYRGPALVVDLGWHGSLQRSLIRLGRIAQKEHIDIQGAYLGTMSDCPRSVDGTSVELKGWLFEFGEPNEVFRTTVYQSVEIVELLFSAPHHGINHVEFVDGVPKPVFTMEQAEEHRLKIAELIHDEVEIGARELRSVVCHLDPAALWHAAMRQLSTLYGEPDNNDIARFRAVFHAEGFGASAYRPVISPAPTVNSPKALVGALDASYWRHAFKAGLSNYQRMMLYAALIARRLNLWGSRRLRV